MNNSNLLTGDYFYLNNDPNYIYITTEVGINYAPLLTTNNPAFTSYIGTYFHIKPEDKINYLPNFHFLTPTAVDIFRTLTNLNGEPMNSDNLRQGDFWIFGDNLNLKLSDHLTLIVHSKNPDLIGTLVRDSQFLQYETTHVFRPDYHWLTPEKEDFNA